MRAVTFHAYGDPSVLRVEDVAAPEPDVTEVLIDVEACGVEPGLDAMARRGTGSWPIRFPHILGAASVGTVRIPARVAGPPTAALPGEGQRVALIPSIACGRCTACREGRQNSCASRTVVGIDRWGGYADHLTVPVANVVPIPDTLPATDAAALVVSGVTAWHLVVRRARVQPGETVVITGAAGNVGLVAAQIAASRGARVVAIGRSDEALSALRRLVPAAETVTTGATVADTTERVLATVGRDGAEVVIDTVGAGLWGVVTTVVAPDGRIATAGGASGRLLEIDLPTLYRRNVTLLTSSQGTTSDAHALFAAAAAGRVSLPASRTFNLEDAAEAHRTLEAGGSGKLVLTHT